MKSNVRFIAGIRSEFAANMSSLNRYDTQCHLNAFIGYQRALDAFSTCAGSTSTRPHWMLRKNDIGLKSKHKIRTMTFRCCHKPFKAMRVRINGIYHNRSLFAVNPQKKAIRGDFRWENHQRGSGRLIIPIRLNVNGIWSNSIQPNINPNWMVFKEARLILKQIESSRNFDIMPFIEDGWNAEKSHHLPILACCWRPLETLVLLGKSVENSCKEKKKKKRKTQTQPSRENSN